MNPSKSSHAVLSFDPLAVGYLYLMVVTLPIFFPSPWNISAAINLGKLDSDSYHVYGLLLKL